MTTTSLMVSLARRQAPQSARGVTWRFQADYILFRRAVAAPRSDRVGIMFARRVAYPRALNHDKCPVQTLP